MKVEKDAVLVVCLKVKRDGAEVINVALMSDQTSSVKALTEGS